MDMFSVETFLKVLQAAYYTLLIIKVAREIRRERKRRRMEREDD